METGKAVKVASEGFQCPLSGKPIRKELWTYATVIAVSEIIRRVNPLNRMLIPTRTPSTPAAPEGQVRHIMIARVKVMMPSRLGDRCLTVALHGSFNPRTSVRQVLRTHGRANSKFRVEGKEPGLGDGGQI